MTSVIIDSKPANRPPCDRPDCQERGGNLFFTSADLRPWSLCKTHFDEEMAKAKERDAK